MSREHHTDIQRADGRASEARYGPGSTAAARRAQLAAQAASRNASRSSARSLQRRRSKAEAQPILSAVRQRLIVAALAAFTLLTFAGIFLASPLTQVRKVRISGASTLLPEEAAQTKAAAAIPPGSNLFRLRTRAIQDALSRLPWVASAKVSRVFPNALAVSITPRVSKAQFQVMGQDWEVDGSGTLIRRLRPGAILPVISCAAAAELKPGQRVDAAGVAGALKVVSDLRLRGVRIANIEVDQSGELCLNMSDNVAIRLGQEDALPTKIDYIQRIYDDKPGIASEVASIDLRWPESPSCVLRKASSYRSETTQQSEPSQSGIASRNRVQD